MDEKIIHLKRSIPIKRQGITIEHVNEIKLTRFKARHLKLVPKQFLQESEDGKNPEAEPEDVIKLIAGLSNLPIESIEEIDLVEDWNHVMAEFTDFFEKSLSQLIGEK